MSVVAIIGAGPLGSSVAQRLAERSRISELRLIDAAADVATGKSLDILQSGPIGRFDTRVVALGDTLAAVNASVIVVADSVTDGEWEGDRGRALVADLVRAGTTAPIVFAGPRQLPLLAAARDLGVQPQRLVATAPSATASALCSLAALELDLAAVEIAVVGTPKRFVVSWSTAVATGALLADRLPAHRLLALSQALPHFWPPAPYAIGSATARVVEALVNGSRHLHQAATIVRDVDWLNGRTLMLPLRLGRGGVLESVLPSLSAAERTELVNSLES